MFLHGLGSRVSIFVFKTWKDIMLMRSHIKNRKESGHKIHNGCKKMTTSIFKNNETLISQMLHGSNLFPSSSSAFCLPPIISMFKFWQR